MDDFNYSDFVLPKGKNSDKIKVLLQGNLLENCHTLVMKSDISIDTKIFFAILISSGVRINEAINYKSDISSNITKVRLKILKKRTECYQDIEIKTDRWKLTAEDFKIYEGKMKSERTYNRLCHSILGISPRDYRSLFTIWALRETKDIHFVRDLMNHSNISVTNNYLKQQQINHQKLWDIKTKQTNQKRGQKNGTN